MRAPRATSVEDSTDRGIEVRGVKLTELPMKTAGYLLLGILILASIQPVRRAYRQARLPIAEASLPTLQVTPDMAVGLNAHSLNETRRSQLGSIGITHVRFTLYVAWWETD